MKDKFLIIISLVLMLSIVGCSAPIEESKLEKDNEYYFEPNTSTVKGRLIARLHYGAPNYGEEPETDEKEYPFILLLDSPIEVIERDDASMNRSISHVLEVQLVLMNEDDLILAKQNINKDISVKGSFFSSFTGHHHTDVLMEVEEMEEILEWL